MAARHGTRRGYGEGCRCDDCKDAQRLYQRRYRERQALRNVTPVSRDEVATEFPCPVESAVKDEIGGLAAEARPGLAQVALCMARLLDNAKAVNQQPAAAKVLAALLDKFRSASAGGRRGGLALVRTMTGGTTSD
jgi:hypothetical protein